MNRGCCDEYGCKRTTPVLIRRGGLSGRWFAITNYRKNHGGYIEASTKHDITEGLVAQLKAEGWTEPEVGA